MRSASGSREGSRVDFEGICATPRARSSVRSDTFRPACRKTSRSLKVLASRDGE